MSILNKGFSPRYYGDLLFTTQKRKKRGNKKDVTALFRRFSLLPLLKTALFIFAIGAFSVLTVKTVFANPFKTVTISDGYGDYAFVTKEGDVRELLNSGMLALKEGDNISIASNQKIDNNMVIHVSRAKFITITYKNETHSVKISDGTVADAVAKAQIKYNSQDENSGTKPQ